MTERQTEIKQEDKNIHPRIYIQDISVAFLKNKLFRLENVMKMIILIIPLFLIKNNTMMIFLTIYFPWRIFKTSML